MKLFFGRPILFELIEALDLSGPIGVDPLAELVDDGQFLQNLRAGVVFGEPDGADLEHGVLERVVHHERQRLHVADGTEGTPDRDPKRMPGAVGGGRQVETGLVASPEKLERDRRPQPHILAERLESEAPDTGLILDDQVETLRRGGPHLHHEVFESGPIRRKVGAEVLEDELLNSLGSLEGEPFGLRVGCRAKHQYG